MTTATQLTRVPQAAVFPPPDRFQIEREIRQQLPSGAIDRLTALMKKDQSHVSKMYNPNCDERWSPTFMFLLSLWSLDQFSVTTADYQLNLVHRERRKWLSVRGVRSEGRVRLTKTVGEEFVEAMATEMDAKPLDTQIKEYTDLLHAVEKKLDSLVAEKQKSYGGEVRTETREIVRELVKGKRRKAS